MNISPRLPGKVVFVFAVILGFTMVSCTQTNAESDKKKTKAPKKYVEPAKVKVPKGREVATFGGGCFWCTETIFERLRGVDKVVSGYSGGHVKNPTYEQVVGKTTGHAEVIQVTYDPKKITYGDLLEVFFLTHNPTTLNQQGNDVGPQYRSVIYYHSKKQKELAEKYRKKYDEKKDLFSDPIVTEIGPYLNFYTAEKYHQNYYKRNPNQSYCKYVIAPKVKKFLKKFKKKLKGAKDEKKDGKTEKKATK